MMLPKNCRFLPYGMWLLALSFFAFQFILRLWPGLMMPEIMNQFTIDATGFGVLASFYYYGYAGMQIPLAILLDKFGVKIVMFCCAALCGVATLIFTYTEHWLLACLSRFLVGVASAGGFLGTSKVIAQWFPKIQYARMIGLSFSFGLLGALYGGKPISLLIENYNWQNVALTLAVGALLIGLACLLFLKNKTAAPSVPSFKINDFKTILRSRSVWLLAIANLLMVGALEGFADVWGVVYLMKAYSMSKAEAAKLISCVFLGMLVGGPLLAFASKRFGNYKIITFCGFSLAVLFMLLLKKPPFGLALLFFVIGIFCCYQVIVFAAGSDIVSPQLLGVTVAFLNCINMLGGSFFHTLIGYVLDIFEAGELGVQGLKEYSLYSFENALLIIPVCALLGALLTACVGYKQNGLRNLCRLEA